MSISNHDDSLNNKPEKLDQELTEDSWENFMPDPNMPVPTDELRSRIEQQVGSMPAPVKKMRYAWTAIAASAILLAGAFLLNGRKDKPAPALATARPPAPKPAATKEISNDAVTTMNILLPDGSKVALAGKSTLKYYTPFIDNKRDIYLKGAAIFSVKKDQKMPFIVHAKDITTTVLGTVFSVSDKLARFTTVHLFSGKVVVKKDAAGSSGDIYLSPGDELMIDKKNFETEVKHPLAVVVKQHKDSVQTDISRPIAFDNQPLEEIFRQLQECCHINIQFETASLRNMTFTGKFDNKKETVGSFLQTLCDLNELRLTKTDEAHYTIQARIN